MKEKFRKFLEDHLVLEEFLEGLESVSMNLDTYCAGSWPWAYVSNAPCGNTSISMDTWQAIDQEWRKVVSNLHKSQL